MRTLNTYWCHICVTCVKMRLWTCVVEAVELTLAGRLSLQIKFRMTIGYGSERWQYTVMMKILNHLSHCYGFDIHLLCWSITCPYDKAKILIESVTTHLRFHSLQCTQIRLVAQAKT
ncbi:hypothetical protein NDU88_004653 [Pleurodeles waltl]|uniref:Uncharacterized protein n=1 Tax=Pleurodeles waltl TaxID=8319 RepID=A0AAV7MEM1_PLEWA|nr:hypothetical protein NDU88_004653 [Pleurodeles waltl]